MLDDVARGVVRVTATLDESRRQSRRLHGPVDRGASAVHDNRTHADRLHEHDVDQQVAQGVDVVEQAAAEFDYRDLVPELANPAQRLDQHVGFLGGCQQLGAPRSGGACSLKAKNPLRPRVVRSPGSRARLVDQAVAPWYRAKTDENNLERLTE